jgi:uncharacterized protein YkwD
MSYYSAFKYVISITFLISFLFNLSVLAQNDTGDGNRKRIYISAKITPKESNPKIQIIKRANNVSGKPSSNLTSIRPTDYNLEKKAFNLINNIRIEMGLKKLIWSDRLNNLARQHSENMAKYSFFSHYGLNGRTIGDRATDFGVDNWSAIGENIAFNRGIENPVEFAVERWMLSSGHRKNLLNNRWKETGIGISVTSDNQYYFTQVFTR